MIKAPIIHLQIEGMSCASCAGKVEKALTDIQGATLVQVNLANHSAQIDGLEGSEATDALIRAVEKAGYKAAPISTEDVFKTQSHEHTRFINMLKKSITAAAFGLTLMATGWLQLLPALNESQSFWITVGIITFAIMTFTGGHYYSGAVRSIRYGNTNMDTLIALGTGTAWAYSMFIALFPDLIMASARHFYFEAAVMIIAFINLGQALEARGRGKTSTAIRKLIGLTPKTACLVQNGIDSTVPIETLKPGDMIRIKPGEKIPVDGEIVEGSSTINEAMLTGEPMPVQKQAGDTVTGGCLNTTGSFIFKVTHTGSDTVLAHIIEMVQRAQTSRPAIGRMVNKVTAVFVPAVISIAMITYVVWYLFGPGIDYAFVTAVTVLIIACPCALGLATPMSIMVGIGKAAEYGILIRNGEALERAGHIDTIILDKTGTITAGTPEVTDIIADDPDQALQLAASLESHSEHPLAEAIMTTANKKGLSLFDTKDFKSHTGLGVSACIEGQNIALGSKTFMDSLDIHLPENFEKTFEKLSKQAKTVVFLSKNNEIEAVFAISDPIKEDTHIAIKRMHQLGMEVVMLTGDNQHTAAAVAKEAGIDRFFYEMSPQDKDGKVARLQRDGKQVAMVGDGINDAAALARADVGIAMGSGTDIAIESADITLMHGSLHGVPRAITISRATIRNIKQNLFGAFIYNVFGIPIAAGVLFPLFGILLNPVMASAAMAASSVTVVSNANRLRKFNPDDA